MFKIYQLLTKLNYLNSTQASSFTVCGNECPSIKISITQKDFQSIGKCDELISLYV